MKYKLTYTIKPYVTVVDSDIYNDEDTLESIQEIEAEQAEASLSQAILEGDVSVEVSVEEVKK